MITPKAQIGEVSYNASAECFEALVTFHTDTGSFRVPATANLPLTAEFSRIAEQLEAKARTQLGQPGALRTRILAQKSQATAFDWQSFLHGDRAA